MSSENARLQHLQDALKYGNKKDEVLPQTENLALVGAKKYAKIEGISQNGVRSRLAVTLTFAPKCRRAAIWGKSPAPFLRTAAKPFAPKCDKSPFGAKQPLRQRPAKQPLILRRL